MKGVLASADLDRTQLLNKYLKQEEGLTDLSKRWVN